MELYNKLGVRIVSKREYELLNKSIRYYYNIGEDITYYTPALHLLTNYFKEENYFNKAFNNIINVIQINWLPIVIIIFVISILIYNFATYFLTNKIRYMSVKIRLSRHGKKGIFR
jgi:hypothetical protein